MTAPVIAVLDKDSAILSLMHELLTEEGYALLLWGASAQPDCPYYCRQRWRSSIS
jgi:hypothetical protein